MEVKLFPNILHKRKTNDFGKMFIKCVSYYGLSSQNDILLVNE